MKSPTCTLNLSKLFTYPLLGLALFLASCSTVDTTVEPTPINNKVEKIDINISGDFSNEIHTESEDLTSFTVRPVPIINAGEHLVRMKIDDNKFVDLTLYQRHYDNPLQEQFQYGAFGLDQLHSKSAYIVADYYIDGVRTYCSAPEHLTNAAQYNVFRVVKSADQYLIRIEDLRLFDIVNKRKVTDENYIEIYGTFTLDK